VTRTAALFAGVMPRTPEELVLAEAVGEVLGRAGYTVLHGGYNGLMEAAARGASRHGVRVTAVTLAGRPDWGEFNPYVKEPAVLAESLGRRLDEYLNDADLIVGIGGGIGTFHEIAAALYYATAIRTVPVRLVGPAACRLDGFMRAEGWLKETPTRPVGFLRALPDAEALGADLAGDAL
jgi:uncharacterized protein (TIGR00725 family)